MSLIAEFQNRKVFRAAAVYAVVGWLLLQVVSVVLPALKLPEWTVTFTTVLLMLGFPVTLVLAWSFDIVRDRGPRSSPGGDATMPIDARSIVVLPFANMTEDPAQAHFADGLVEDLTTRLQAIAGLRVNSRQSAFALQGRSVDARSISRELGCRYVVEGSVRKLGDHMRVTAQLIDAPGDQHVWAERYDRRLEDAFALQDEICDQIVAAIEARLQPEAATGLTPSVAPSESQRPARRQFASWWVIPGAIVLLAMAGLLTWTLQQRGQERWARETALPELESLIAKDDYAAAFDLAARISKVIPNDPRLKSLEPAFMAPVLLASDPPGAKVSYRPYGSNETAWREIGTTPIEGLPVPRGVGIWKFEKDGRVTAIRVTRNPGVQLGNPEDPDTLTEFKTANMTIPLVGATSAPPGMVLVPATNLTVSQASDNDLVALPAFFIDRFEVANREYKEFVDAGGYRDVANWDGLPIEGGADGLRAALARFVDATGRPGPSTWEAGTFRDGTADQPVAGISWFEAAAYARFRAKELPTAYHWYRAAYSLNELVESVGSAVVRTSNYSGKNVSPVGQLPSLGPYGTYDMAGNVREWLWTEASHGRWIAGGGFNEPAYMYNQLDAADPWNRSPGNGFRCIRTADAQPVTGDLRKPIVQPSVDFAALRPVTDEVYALLEQQLGYSRDRLDPQLESLQSANPAWTHQRITLASGYDDTRFAVQLFLPAGVKPPYAVVIYGPHAGHFSGTEQSDEFDPTQSSLPTDFIPKSGRAFAVIAFDGTFERAWSRERKASMSSADRYRLHLRNWRQELGRTLDYFATRQDLDPVHTGYFAVSFGAQAMMPLLAVEPRVGMAVLVSGGIDLQRVPLAEQPFNYLPHIRQPVLMLNGRWDIDVDMAAQQRQLDLLGTPPARKRHIVFEAGHGALPYNQVVRASLDWFDEYLR